MYFKLLYTCTKEYFKFRSRFLSLILLALVFSPSYAVDTSPERSQNGWHHAEQAIMGTLVTIDLQHNDPFVANKVIQQVFAVMWDINNEMSNFKPDSALSKINQEASIRPIKVSDRLFGLLEKSLYYSRLSGGAFDITVGTIGQHYNFKNKKKPTDSIIEIKQQHINYNNIKLDKTNKTIRITNKHARLDLGGIAKGFAIEQSLIILNKYDIKNAYISAGGDSYAVGRKNKRPWLIAIKDPRNKKNNIVIPVSNLAISTSGDYERYFDENNVRYHHIINPKTGRSASKSVSVTVVGKSPVDTDALSTTLFVLGDKKGIELINKIDGYDAIYVYPSGNTVYSDGIKKSIN